MIDWIVECFFRSLQVVLKADNSKNLSGNVLPNTIYASLTNETARHERGHLLQWETVQVFAFC